MILVRGAYGSNYIYFHDCPPGRFQMIYTECGAIGLVHVGAHEKIIGTFMIVAQALSIMTHVPWLLPYKT